MFHGKPRQRAQGENLLEEAALCLDREQDVLVDGVFRDDVLPVDAAVLRRDPHESSDDLLVLERAVAEREATEVGGVEVQPLSDGARVRHDGLDRAVVELLDGRCVPGYGRESAHHAVGDPEPREDSAGDCHLRVPDRPDDGGPCPTDLFQFVAQRGRLRRVSYRDYVALLPSDVPMGQLREFLQAGVDVRCEDDLVVKDRLEVPLHLVVDLADTRREFDDERGFHHEVRELNREILPLVPYGDGIEYRGEGFLRSSLCHPGNAFRYPPLFKVLAPPLVEVAVEYPWVHGSNDPVHIHRMLKDGGPCHPVDVFHLGGEVRDCPGYLSSGVFEPVRLVKQENVVIVGERSPYHEDPLVVDDSDMVRGQESFPSRSPAAGELLHDPRRISPSGEFLFDPLGDDPSRGYDQHAVRGTEFHSAKDGGDRFPSSVLGEVESAREPSVVRERFQLDRKRLRHQEGF